MINFRIQSKGKLKEKHISTGTLASRSHYLYDKIGQLTHAKNEHSQIDLSYDSMGRLLSEKTTSPTGSYQLQHQYDGLGNRLSTQLPDGKTLNWLYYGSGHLHQINLDGEVVSDYERDALYREVSRTQGQLHSTQSYDPLSRLLQQQTQYQNPLANAGETPPPQLNQQGNSPVQLQRNYQYDKAGELIQLNDLRTGKTDYQYDALGRITQAQHANLNERFSFDPAHNLIPAGAGPLKDNKLKVFADKRYDHDGFGNVTSKKIGSHTQMQFSYTAEHQLREAQIDKKGVQQTVTYQYDPFGRRINKTDTTNTTAFIWDGSRLLSETAGNQTKTYVYEQGGFVPVAQVDDNGIQYYHTDHLGTPRELTDSEGNITWEATYQTWGNTLKVSHQNKAGDKLAPAVQPLRFQGQYFDEETGLHYNYHRYYDPDTGRYMTSDPIGVDGGLNTYGYADQNPVAFVDAFGLRATEKAPDPLDMKKKFPSVEDVLCFCVDIYDSYKDDHIKQEQVIYERNLKSINESHDKIYQGCVYAADMQDCIKKGNAARREELDNEHERHKKAIDHIAKDKYGVLSDIKSACDTLP